MLALGFSSGITAQDDPPPEEMQRPPMNQPQDRRGDALRELGLSREQMQQMRRLNMERRPLMNEAQRRVREANRALDDAIYADEVNETEVQARLKELHAAQGDVIRVRFMNELAVRKMLTPEQLVKFRELRARFEESRQNFERQRQNRQNNPMRPMDQRMPGNPARPQPNRAPIRNGARPN